jgi:hypothetical protein
LICKHEKMPEVLDLMLMPGMSDVAAMMLGVLVLGLILRGGWWLMNWKVSHPRSIHTGTGVGPLSTAVSNADGKADLPAVFRMSAALQVILYVLLLSPPLVATIVIRDEWEDWGSFLMEHHLFVMSFYGMEYILEKKGFHQIRNQPG